MEQPRKPHNLITAYWDDCEYFTSEAGKLVPERVGEHDYLAPQDKRCIRYSILSAFLFLEAFINAEYFHQQGYTDPRMLTQEERDLLYKDLRYEHFGEKWSRWLLKFGAPTLLPIKGTKEFQNIKKLEDWRNQLTHYKIHDLMLVANDIEKIENARKAHRIAAESIQWYYDITKMEVPGWIVRDIFPK